jgi:hypothetical protein
VGETQGFAKDETREGRKRKVESMGDDWSGKSLISVSWALLPWLQGKTKRDKGRVENG